MNTCRCKICKTNLGSLVNDLATQDLSIKSIQKQLLYQNLDVTELTIERHLKAFDLSSGTVEKQPETIEVIPVRQYKIRDSNLSDWGLSMDDPHGVVRYLQECQLKMYLTQLDITFQELMEYANGDIEHYPSTAVSNLKKLWDLLDPVTSISLYSNQQAAMKTIESMGIEIPKISGFKNVST